MTGPELPPETPFADEKPSLIHRVVSGALNQPLLIGLMAALLIMGGIWSVRRLPVDAYPDLSPPMVEIVTQWPGHASEEVERLITVPLEIEMNGLPGLQVSRSISLYGLSDLTLTFANGTDDYFARQQVFERLPSVDLPQGASPDVPPLFSPSGLVYRYVLQSPDRSAMELKNINDWVISKAYKAVPGVADMSGFGGETMQYQALLDPTRLAGAGLSVQNVADALAANNGNAGGGFYSEGGQFFYVRGLGRIHTVEDVGNVVAAVKNGTPILVKDLGNVEIGHAPRLGQFGFMGTNDAVEGVVVMRKGEQAQTVLKGVEAMTRQLNDSILPKDVKIKPFYDRSDLIALTTRTVADNLVRGILLVVVVLILFLYDIRTGLIVAVTIPLSLLFAFICLDLRHIPANLLSIGAIDFGILVDGAVVMVGEHLPPAGTAAWRDVRHQAGDRRGRRRGGPADLLCGGGDRGGVPADLRPGRTVGQAVQADGRYHDLRVGRFAGRDADTHSGAVRLVPQARRARAAQSGLRVVPRLVPARARLVPGPALGHGDRLGGDLRRSRCC